MFSRDHEHSSVEATASALTGESNLDQAVGLHSNAAWLTWSLMSGLTLTVLLFLQFGGNVLLLRSRGDLQLPVVRKM